MIKIKSMKRVLCVLVLLSLLFTIYPQTALAQEDEEFLDMIEHRTFLFFYENTDERGFTIESTAWPIGSSASSGLYLISIPIAIERVWMSYEEGYQRVNTTLNSYYDDLDDSDDFLWRTSMVFSLTGSIRKLESGTLHTNTHRYGLI